MSSRHSDLQTLAAVGRTAVDANDIGFCLDAGLQCITVETEAKYT